MFEQLPVAKKMHHHVRLNQSFCSDLAWWDTFRVAWNDVLLLREVILKSPDYVISTDASGSWACGAVWGTFWLQYKWWEAYQQEIDSMKGKAEDKPKHESKKEPSRKRKKKQFPM